MKFTHDSRLEFVAQCRHLQRDIDYYRTITSLQMDRPLSKVSLQNITGVLMHKVTCFACCAFGLAASSHALAAGEKILYRFYGSFPPALSQAPLVSDAAGNFYGTS